MRRGLLVSIALIASCGVWSASSAAADEVVVLDMDEGRGMRALDSSGSEHHGTLEGGAVHSPDTVDGSPSSVALDGVDGLIDLGPLDVDGEGLTLAAWFSADGFAEPYRDPRLISKATGTGDDEHVFMLGTIAAGGDTVLRGRVRVGGSTTTLIADSGAISTGEWHHAALTHDGTTARLFLDGDEVGEVGLAGQLDVDPSVPVAVGAQPKGAGNRFFDGLIDDVRILSRALSADEIGALVGDRRTPPGPAETSTTTTTPPDPAEPADVPSRVSGGLVALYSFEDGSGSVVADVSGVAPALDLNIDDPTKVTWLPGALSVDAATVVTSDGPATKITDSAGRSGAVTVEAWLVPGRIDQDGPASIVSISGSSAGHNVSLDHGLWGSQPSDLYSARLRTSATNAQGQPELTTPSGSLDLSLAHVVYTHDAAGTSALYVDGVERASTTVDGDLDAWDPLAALVLANEPSGDHPWLGELHLVALYGRALTADEVDRNFAAGPPSAAPVTEPSEADTAGELRFSRVEIDPSPPEQAHVKALGDISGDGRLDVAVGGGREGDGLFWYEYPDWTKHEIVPPGTGFTTDMKITDVDGDGDQDIVVPTGFHRGDTLWWYENPSAAGGDPRTDRWVEHEIGSAPAHDVEVGDIDGDGDVDVVVRDRDVTLFVQDAPDRWRGIALGRIGVEGTDLGDIDRDGDVDIVVGNRWLENPLPTGTSDDEWVTHTIVPDWPDAAAATIADYDGDGRADVALAPSESENGRLSWFEGPDDPTEVDSWTEHPVDPDVEFLHQFRAADIDLDGDVDLVTAEMHQAAAPQNVSVYLNDGGTSWTETVLATTGSHNIQVGDIGDDGDIDIVGVNWHGLTPLELWRNELVPTGGDRTEPDAGTLDRWQRHVADDGVPARAVFVEDADVNGDGLLDVVLGGWWYENTGTIGGGWERHTIGGPLNQMAAVHDFDGDGDPDVLGTEGVGSAPNSDFVWAENDGSGTFTVHQNVDRGVGDFLQGVTVARFRGPLQVALSWHDQTIGLQMLTVPPEPAEQQWTWEELSDTSLGEALDHGDIDGDGDLDLSLGTTWLRNDDEGWSDQVVHDPAVGEPDRVQLTDMDDDGDLDALVGYGHDPEGKLAWYENAGDPSGQWPEHLMANVANPQSVDHADVDGDGDVDIVAGEHRLPDERPEDAALFIMENRGSGGDAWRRHVIHVGDEHHDGAQLGDFDNDGDLDVVSIGWTHSQLLFYENLSGESEGADVAD